MFKGTMMAVQIHEDDASAMAGVHLYLGVVDICLENTPLPLVYDALAMKLHLVDEAGSD